MNARRQFTRYGNVHLEAARKVIHVVKSTTRRVKSPFIASVFFIRYLG